MTSLLVFHVEMDVDVDDGGDVQSSLTPWLSHKPTWQFFSVAATKLMSMSLISYLHGHVVCWMMQFPGSIYQAGRTSSGVLVF